MRTLALKTHIFLHQKHQNQPLNKKVVLLVAPFFLGLKLQHFSSMALKTHIVANKNLKINI
jgi:hypothetical protein